MGSSAWVSCALAGAAVLGMGTPASAQDVRKPSHVANEWENEVAVYFWLTRMAGDAEIQGADLDVDSDYADMLKNLKSSVGVHYELWQHDSWGLGADLFGMVLEDDPDVPAGDGELQTEFLMAEATLIGRTRSGQAYLDYFAGVRWMNLETRFEAPGVDEDRTRNYVDPIVGARVGSSLTPWFHLSLRVDFGGFGVGTDWSTNVVVLGTLYASPTVKFGLGWRTMLFSIDDSDHEFDSSLTGPLFSASFGF